MKINWKVRLKSGTFWVGLISLCITFIYALLEMFGIVPDLSENQVMNIVVIILQILAFVGVISDPTTKGISDSKQALTYEEPKKD